MESTGHEIHEYLRLSITIYMTWFTFFITLNFLVAGWFSNQLLLQKSTDTSLSGVVVISGYFLTQGILSFIGTFYMRNWYGGMAQKLFDLGENNMAQRAAILSFTHFFQHILDLILITFVTLILFWLFLLILGCFPNLISRLQHLIHYRNHNGLSDKK